MADYSLAPIPVILFDFRLPICSQRGTCTHGGGGTAHRLVVEASALAVAMVVHGSFGSNSQTAGCLHSIDVGPQEEELPSIFLLLMTDHLLYLVHGIAAAGVLHAVSGDDEERVLRDVLAPSVLVDVPDVLDGPAKGVQQCRAAPDPIIPSSYGRNFPNRDTVMEYFRPVIKENGGDKGFTRLPLLLFAAWS